ncbi:MAG TPA: hypothetical protein VEU30_03400 [Thermoanaerobaculia bacterium]|nr:hypothetical protein [Thermoanaerobaculia bacterium]
MLQVLDEDRGERGGSDVGELRGDLEKVVRGLPRDAGAVVGACLDTVRAAAALCPAPAEPIEDAEDRRTFLADAQEWIGVLAASGELRRIEREGDRTRLPASAASAVCVRGQGAVRT